MPFPANPSVGDTYVENNNTYKYLGPTNGWYRTEVRPTNDTTYIGSDGAPGGAGGNTQVVFNDNGSLAGDSGLTFNKTTDALSSGAFVPTGSTVPANGLYLSGTNTVGISTNSTGRLFVDASGRVGLGISGPLYRAQISGTSAWSTAYNVYNNDLFIQNSSSDAGLGNYGGSIGLSGPSVGENTNKRVVIAAVQTASDADQCGLAFFTHPSSFGTQPIVEQLRIDHLGRVGIGTAAPGDYNSDADNLVVQDTAGNGGITIRTSTTNAGGLFFADGVTADGSAATNRGMIRYDHSSDSMQFWTAGNNERLRIDSSGRVGIGAASNTHALQVFGNSGSTTFAVGDTTLTAPYVYLLANATAGVGNLLTRSNHPLTFGTNNAEAARIDTSGRLLVGTSTARTNFGGGSNTSPLQVEGTSFTNSRVTITRNSNDAGRADLTLAKTRSATVGGNTIVQADDNLGQIAFAGSDGTNFPEAALIVGQVDGTPGANDMPGRLVFSTTADGASSPTERMRIVSSGDIIMGKTSTGREVVGVAMSPPNGVIGVTSGSLRCADFNRQNDDGSLVDFYQANILEGSISVSGTTVSYNGAHLSRWSQLPGGVERTEILRGTVLSNIDEMCDWGEEENEQLNRMKVSDLEGDPNVSGVFQAWDDDDDTYTDDFYCAMTGDFIIRISAGIPVHRGQLLMSAGDGTAKPQDDDIVRSKTIAKVTSHHIVCTYDDGSYCVPCVLMAC